MRFFPVVLAFLVFWSGAGSAGEEPQEPVIIAFLARDGEGGKPVRRDIEWTLIRLNDGKRFLHHAPNGTPEVTLFPGVYRVEVVRLKDGARVVREFETGPVNRTIMMPFPPAEE